MNRYLFVYGSLLPQARNPMGERLAREARQLGEGSLPGRLYRVGWYPGLVEVAGEERVYGVVYALRDPVRALTWLDAYEGLTGDGPHRGEYARCERPVHLAGGRQVSCWVYLYCGDTAGLAAVRGGRWLTGPAACNRPLPRHNQ